MISKLKFLCFFSPMPYNWEEGKVYLSAYFILLLLNGFKSNSYTPHNSIFISLELSILDDTI